MSSNDPNAYSGNQLLAATTAVLAITTSFLGLRLYARTLTNASRSWDDFLLLPAWMLFIALAVVCYLSLANGDAGRHVYFVAASDPQAIERLAFLLYLLEWFYVPSCMLSRMSVILLYLRVFNNKAARAGCWTMFVFVLVYAIATVVGAQLQCTPLQLTWDKSLKGHCFDTLAYYRWTTVPNIVADVAILCLPIKSILGLKASVKRKAGIGVIFLTGGIGLVASCLRAYFFFALGDMIQTDPTWVAVPLLIQTVVETGTYLCGACLIGFRPLYKQVPRWMRKNVFRSAADSRHHPSSIGKLGSKVAKGSFDEPPSTEAMKSSEHESYSKEGQFGSMENSYRTGNFI